MNILHLFLFIFHFSFIPKRVKVLGTDGKKEFDMFSTIFISQFIADIVQIQSQAKRWSPQLLALISLPLRLKR